MSTHRQTHKQHLLDHVDTHIREHCAPEQAPLMARFANCYLHGVAAEDLLACTNRVRPYISHASPTEQF